MQEVREVAYATRLVERITGARLTPALLALGALLVYLLETAAMAR